MYEFAIARWIVVLLAAAALPAGQDCPLGAKAPEPSKEHRWLQQLVGEWTFESEGIVAPGLPPVKSQGSERARALGDIWLVTECNGKSPMGTPMTAMLTLGYDPQRKKYVGTWIDSMASHLWTYEGTLDAGGKILTLEAEGPNMAIEGKTAKYKDVIEIKDRDHKVLTSSMQGDDGKWYSFATVNYRRTKP